jgi:hypothetical protein
MVLDEYKEDFSSGIDDLQFDNPEDSYGYSPQNETAPVPPTEYATKRPQPAPVSTQAQQHYTLSPLPPSHPSAPYGQSNTPYYPPPAYQPPQDPLYYNQPLQTVYENKPSISEVLKSREPRLGCLRVLVLSGISLAVIGVTFWGSFIFGQKIFAPPVKETFLKNAATTIPDFLNPSTRKTVPMVIPPEVSTPKTPEKIYVRSAGLPKKPAAVTQRAPAPRAVAPVRSVYRVIAGSFSNKQNAQLALQQLKEDGFDALLTSKSGGYQVQIGAFSSKSTAQRLLERALSFGYEAFIAN